MLRLADWVTRWLLQFLDNLLVKIYSHPHPRMRGLFLEPFYGLRRACLLLAQGLTFEVYEIQGTARGSSETMRVVYFAEGRGLSYLASQLFEKDSYKRRKLRQVRAWELNQAVPGLARSADLVVVEQNTLRGWRPEYRSWVSAPTWVRMALDLDPRLPWAQVEQTFRKHERNIRRMKRAGFRCEISRDPLDFAYFYNHMYIPFVYGRHPGYGLLDTQAHLFSLFQQGFLLFIVDAQGRRVAADLAAIYGDVYFGVASGVVNNEEALLEAGAVSALYYYAIQWCHQNGIRRCDIGEVRPFEHDGLYQYKRRWGYKPVRELWNTREWLFWNPNDSPTACLWLESNPTLPEFTHTGVKTPIPAVCPLPSFSAEAEN